MTKPLQTIANVGLTEQIPLDTLSEILLALKTQIVFCDLIKGNGIPVRAARRFLATNIPGDIPSKDPDWLSRNFQGNAKGYEVQTMEGWSVPERVYYVVRKRK